MVGTKARGASGSMPIPKPTRRSIPYPLPDNEFDGIVCRHVAEHVPDGMSFIAELHRITRPGGRIKITTPHYTKSDWATDPTHRNHFNSYSFNCFIGERQLFPFYTDSDSTRFGPMSRGQIFGEQSVSSSSSIWISAGLA